MSRGPKSVSTPSPVGTSLWVVGATDPDCPHPTEALEAIGSDGMNEYYRCAGCTGVVVFARAMALAVGIGE